MIEGDALELDPAELVRAHGAGGPARICANLPYNIATALLGQMARSRALAAYSTAMC